MGALVKAASKRMRAGVTLEQVLEENQGHYRLEPALQSSLLSDQAGSEKDLRFEDVISAVNHPIADLNRSETKGVYKFKSHTLLPEVRQHLLHAGVMSYNLPLIEDLVRGGAKLGVRDGYGRNIWHLAEIVEANPIVSFIESLPPRAQAKLGKVRDEYGRTPLEIREWKQSRRNFYVEPRQDVRGRNESGWRSTVATQWATESMDIDMVPASEMTAERLISDHISVLKPVIIKDVLSASDELTRLFKRTAFESRYGGTVVSTGDIPYAATLGREEQRGVLSKLGRSADKYVFSRLHQERDERLIAEFDSFELVAGLPNTYWQFYLGPMESGAPVHFHGNAWNILMHGRKKWLMYPPLQGFYSTVPIRSWLKKGYPRAQEFTQEAGDLVYVPRYWAHGVINLKESIGVATEFLSPHIF